ncbi:MAG: hypothetical protein AABZ12_00420 [Planctomycetota bacterium]
MSEPMLILVLFGVGVLTLVAELFLPSHAVLTIAGLTFLIAGIVQTYQHYGNKAGTLAVLACMVALPIFAVVAVKVWPRTWIGRRIAPPNPVLTSRDTSVPVGELAHFVGQAGRATSTLRPVGVCEFDGRRISCVAEFGMIDAGKMVVAVGVLGANLAVREKTA